MNAEAPTRNLEELKGLISSKYQDLSPRLQQIARYALEHPNEMALETITVIGENAGVPASAMIRFAKTFGYEGFSDMQRLFQIPIINNAPSYSERIRRLKADTKVGVPKTPGELLRAFSSVDIVSLEHLQNEMLDDQLKKAVALLMKANSVYVIGRGRALPVASYLAYTLSHAEKRAHLLAGVGGLLNEESQCITPDDVLIAISYQPYSEKTVALVNDAAERKIPCIAITDSPVSPLVSVATQSFIVYDSAFYGFRALSASMCLSQALAVSVAMYNTPEK